MKLIQGLKTRARWLAGAAAALAVYGLVAGVLPALSQTYATQNPTYNTTAVKAATTLSAPGTAVFNANSIGALLLEVTGTYTGLTAEVDVSADRASSPTWTQASCRAWTAAGFGQPQSNVAANGLYLCNISGSTQARFNVTAISTGSVVAAMSGTGTDSVQAMNAVPGAGLAVLGSYCMGAESGTMAAGLSAASPVFSFRYSPATATQVGIIRKVNMSIGGTATAFAAGTANIDMFAARSFTVSDTGGTAGTLTTNNGKLRTSYATTGVADFRVSSTGTLTAGTRTLDAQRLVGSSVAVGTGTSTQFLPVNATLFDNRVSENPLVLAQNEGFVLQATVPATGTWTFAVNVCWDEAAGF